MCFKPVIHLDLSNVLNRTGAHLYDSRLTKYGGGGRKLQLFQIFASLRAEGVARFNVSC